MLRETAIVSNVYGEVATIVTKSKLACESCHLSEACGNGLIEKYFSGKVFISEIANSLNAKEGDQVLIELPKSSITRASLLSYFAPILIMFLFILLEKILLDIPYLSQRLEAILTVELNQELITIVFSLVGLIFGFLITNYYNRKCIDLEQYQVNMVRIL